MSPNAVLIRLREEQGWGRPRLAKQFELIGRHHSIPTPELAAMEKQIYRLETGRTLRPTPMYTKLYCLTFGRTTLELFGDLESEVPADATCATRSLGSGRLSDGSPYGLRWRRGLCVPFGRMCDSQRCWVVAASRLFLPQLRRCARDRGTGRGGPKYRRPRVRPTIDLGGSPLVPVGAILTVVVSASREFP
jgi:hypothetical protein